MKVFKDLYNYRELLKTSVKKDIGGKYKHSFLGVLWSFINPLLQILVYALIFPLVMKNGGSYKDYTVFMVCGLIPWAYFTTVINRASFIMIENGNILKKVYFPRSILPLSLVTSETINFLVSCIIILGHRLIAPCLDALSYFEHQLHHDGDCKVQQFHQFHVSILTQSTFYIVEYSIFLYQLIFLFSFSYLV